MTVVTNESIPSMTDPALRIVDSTEATVFEIYTSPPRIVFYPEGKAVEMRANIDFTRAFAASIRAMLVLNTKQEGYLPGLALNKMKQLTKELEASMGHTKLVEEHIK